MFHSMKSRGDDAPAKVWLCRQPNIHRQTHDDVVISDALTEGRVGHGIDVVAIVLHQDLPRLAVDLTDLLEGRLITRHGRYVMRHEAEYSLAHTLVRLGVQDVPVPVLVHLARHREGAVVAQ